MSWDRGYEYLIKKFADDAGHTAAEFYTNRTVVHLMTEMLQPQPGESIYDPTCGSGGMLLSCITQLRRQGKEWRNVRLYGQERNLMTSSIARMNCFLHGIEDFRIERGDTLAEPKLVKGDRLMQFDMVLANPPYSIKQWDRAAFAADPWGRNLYGTPPQGRADYAFWQHILQSLAPKTGRCAILFPHGVLFRQEEMEMRRKLIEADLIECVLGLGPNLFYNSPMEACIVICRTAKPKARRGKILFINAVNEVTRERAQSFLTDDHIERIVKAYESFNDEPSFTYIASREEIRVKEGNLSIPLYVTSSSSPMEVRDVSATYTLNGTGTLKDTNGSDRLMEVLDNWLTSRKAIAESLHAILPNLMLPDLGGTLNGFGVGALFDRKGLRTLPFSEFAQSVNERVEPANAGDEIYVGLEHLDPQNLHIRRWGKGSDVIGTKLRFRKGDIIFGRRRAYQRKLAVAEFDGICSAHAMVVRAKPDVVLPEFLPFLMMSDRFMNRAVEISVGSLSPTINWTTLKLEEFDLPPLDQQRRIAEILWAVDRSICINEVCANNTERLIESLRGERFLYNNVSRRIADCCTKIGSGKTPRGGEKVYVNSGVLFLRSQNIYPEGLRLDDVAYIPPEVDDEMKSTRVEKGDVLLNITGASIGRCTIYNANASANVNQHVCILRAKGGIVIPEFLANFLQSRLGQQMIAIFSTKGNREGLNFQQLGSIQLPLPPIVDQHIFCERVGQAQQTSYIIRDKTDSLRHLLHALLEKLRGN